MQPTLESLVLVCFEPGTEGVALATVMEALGLPGSARDRCRWHEPGLLCVRTPVTPEPRTLDEVRSVPGVCNVKGMAASSPLYARNGQQAASLVAISRGTTLGTGDLVVMAGPCSVESESQVCEIAAIVKEAGAKVLRAGVFKPRTSPYEFGGLGEQGLSYMARAREATGLPIVTEALDVANIDSVAAVADVIQVGSRNMHNFPFLFRLGRHPLGKPVLLKRGFAASVDEFLLAAEYVLLGRLFAGHEGSGLILCERGIRTFEGSTRFTLDVGSIPVMRERTHLPIIADPSHAAGRREYVPALARAAVAAGAEGLLVEVHTDPSKSWCDGRQTLAPADFRELMDDLRQVAAITAARVEKLVSTRAHT